MNARDLTALVHLVGFTTGVVLYAMLGIMTRRQLTYVATPSDARAVDRIPLVTAMLGIVWNVGAMVVYAARDFDISHSLPWIAAVSYTALGFLPAVVVHSTVRRSSPLKHRWYVGIAYAGSAAAGILQLIDAARDATPSSFGLLLLTITYAALLCVLAVTERRRPGFQQSIAAVALAAFAVSALHLSRHAGAVDRDPWLMELIGHHASLPLVLAILYQDYRFAFADLFLKRALSLLALVIVVSLLYASLAAPLIDPHAVLARRALNGGSHLFTTAALLGLWIVTALAYPFIQRRTFRFVDRVVLRRKDYRQLRAEIAQTIASARDVETTLDATCGLLVRALDATAATWRPTTVAPDPGEPTIKLNVRRTEACITVPTALQPSFEIAVVASPAGRSLLSDDLMLIDAVASSVGRRIDEIRIEHDRIAREQWEREIRSLATESELRALRAQLNPHFLFNALNTLGHLMQAAPDRALTTLYRLTALLRAVLRRTNGQFVSLREELEIVEAYLAIEHERFQERLTVSIDVPRELRQARIPPLLLQPLVENAVKHGITPMRNGGTITVRGERVAASAGGPPVLRLSVIDTGLGGAMDQPSTRDSVGLTNIESRLHHYFGASAAIAIRPTPGGGTTVEVSVPWTVSDLADIARPA